MKRSKGLGRGLDALIPPEERNEGYIFMCPVETISPHPGQPRQTFDPDKLEELVQTIHQKGVLSPVIVRSFGEGYQLISGERRWRAAKLAGLHRIPAILRDVSDRDALELSLIENIQREDLRPIEEARAYRSLLDLHGGTQEDLARRLGKDRSTVANALRLLKLPPSVQDLLQQNRITPGHARCLLAVPPENQNGLLEAILTKDLSVRETERLVQALCAPGKTRIRPAPEPTIHLDRVRDRLRSALSTQVKIIQGKRKGRIVIEYYNPKDLDRITDLLLTAGQ
jgi:ParB family transcriptional regulator, chromosome partitioning protein